MNSSQPLLHMRPRSRPSGRRGAPPAPPHFPNSPLPPRSLPPFFPAQEGAERRARAAPLGGSGRRAGRARPGGEPCPGLGPAPLALPEPSGGPSPQACLWRAPERKGERGGGGARGRRGPAPEGRRGAAGERWARPRAARCAPPAASAGQTSCGLRGWGGKPGRAAVGTCFVGAMGEVRRGDGGEARGTKKGKELCFHTHPHPPGRCCLVKYQLAGAVGKTVVMY